MLTQQLQASNQLPAHVTAQQVQAAQMRVILPGMCAQFAVLPAHKPAVLNGQLTGPYLAAFYAGLLQKDM